MPDALLIWDASTTVGNLVVARDTGDAGMHALEADALDILAAHAPALHARRMELRVQYAATGVVGAAYQASTFANATPLVFVAADRLALIAHAAAWRRALADGHPPSQVSVRVVNALPVPQ